MAPLQSSIYFHYLVNPFYFPARSRIKEILSLIFKNHSKHLATINFIFCSDDYLLALNKKHLQHNFYTDIIAFELSSKGEPVMADVFISFDRAKENAQNYKVPAYNEILRLLIHGTLHLCGYSDKKIKDRKLMRQLEDFYLKKFFVSRET